MNLLTLATTARPRRSPVVTGGVAALSWTAVTGAAGYRPLYGDEHEQLEVAAPLPVVRRLKGKQ